MGIGRIIVISTSKIRKITAIKKKRRENGVRAVDLGSNPHSNGEAFSRSKIDFFEIKKFSIIKIILIIRDKPAIDTITSPRWVFLIGS